MQAQGGLGIDDPFNESQLHIVLDFTDALIDDFASRLDPYLQVLEAHLSHMSCLTSLAYLTGR